MAAASSAPSGIPAAARSPIETARRGFATTWVTGETVVARLDCRVPVASLYRRHRPRTFADVVGQEHVVRTLKNAVEQGRVHHAYLFVGSRGTGKTAMAKILA